MNTTTAADRPMAVALIHAHEEHQRLEAAAHDACTCNDLCEACEAGVQHDCETAGTCPACTAVTEAEAEIERALEAWRTSDEEREWAYGGESLGGGRERGHYARPSEIEGELRAWTKGGDWDAEGTIWVRDYAWAAIPYTGDIDEDSEVSVRVAIEQAEPECTEAEHDWQSPYEMLGGLKENPGVWGKGAGLIIRRVCAHCGKYRVIDTWAQDPETGEQGLESVGYESADEDSLAWVASRREDEEVQS